MSYQLKHWKSLAPIEFYEPARDVLIDDAKQKLGGMPSDLESIYRQTNGLNADTFKLLPLADDTDIKRTWDSLQRANDPKVTRFLGRSEELLKRFLVIADIGAGRAAALDRTDGTVWYEDDAQLRQTSLMLDEFIEGMLREANP